MSKRPIKKWHIYDTYGQLIGVRLRSQKAVLVELLRLSGEGSAEIYLKDYIKSKGWIAVYKEVEI